MGLPVSTSQTGMKSALNLTGSTVVDVTARYVYSAFSGAAVGSIYDGTATGDVTAANLVCTVPVNTFLQVNFPLKRGLVVGGTGPMSVSYE